LLEQFNEGWGQLTEILLYIPTRKLCI